VLIAIRDTDILRLLLKIATPGVPVIRIPQPCSLFSRTDSSAEIRDQQLGPGADEKRVTGSPMRYRRFRRLQDFDTNVINRVGLHVQVTDDLDMLTGKLLDARLVF
jgi:hypothetical protein